ncbi:hypothetical protein FKM82_003277 [Ascaphus truei]
MSETGVWFTSPSQGQRGLKSRTGTRVSASKEQTDVCPRSPERGRDLVKEDFCSVQKDNKNGAGYRISKPDRELFRLRPVSDWERAPLLL